MKGSERVKAWFDQLEKVLEEEARLAGLFEHGTMIGAAREFFVSRVVRSVVPPSVHIGSGRVIDADGSTSRQIDVLLYDPRFPLLNAPGTGGFYFAEGVLATIEVKSTLDSETLTEALDNCRSVMELEIHGSSESDLTEHFKASLRKGLSPEEAQDRVNWCVRPPTYIFAFRSKLSFEGFADCVNGWFDGRARTEPYSPHKVLLPRIIAAGNAVGIATDGFLDFKVNEEARASWQAQYGPRWHNAMCIIPAGRRFGWLALHLMNTTGGRLGLYNHAERVGYSIKEYLPVLEYHEEESHKTYAQIIWAEKDSPARPGKDSSDSSEGNDPR